MSPFARRQRNSTQPQPPHDPAATRPAPPSRVPTSKSTSSLSLLRTRSRGSELDEFGAGSSGGSSPEMTIRPVPSRAQRRRQQAEPEGQDVLTEESEQSYTAESPTDQRGTLSPTSPTLSLSLSPSSQANKLTKWLSRSSSAASSSTNHSAPLQETPSSPPTHPKTRTSRSRSIGSLNLLSNALNRGPTTKPASGRPSTADPSSPATARVPLQPPPNPQIEITSSPSTTFSTSPSPASSPVMPSSPVAFASSPSPVEVRDNPQRRGSVASTSSSHNPSLRSFANLSLKPGSGGKRRAARKQRATTDEVLDEWATADLSEGDEDGRIISEEMVRAASRASTASGTAVTASTSGSEGKASGGVLAKSLRRTRSGLKLFQQNRAREESAQSGASATSGQSVEGVYGAGTHRGNASNLSLPDASSPYPSGSGGFGSTTPTPTSAVFPSTSSNASHSNALASSQNGGQGNVTGRFGGWFSSMLHGGSSSSTHLPLPPSEGDESSISAYSSPEKTRRAAPSPSSPGASLRLSSPQKKGSATSLSGAGPAHVGRLGAFDRMLDRAAQYFFDADSKPDPSQPSSYEEIWVLGVRHPGLELPRDYDEEEEQDVDGGAKKRRSLPSLGRKRGSPMKPRKVAPRPPVPPLPTSPTPPADPFLVSSLPVTRASESDAHLRSLLPSRSPSPSPTPPLPPQPTIQGWPPSFYHDFYSRIALTYRSGFPIILCEPPPSSQGAVAGVLSSLGASIGRGGRPQQTEEGRGLSSDTGWGCMLRTGQSLLANALATVHLGRDWRRPLPLSVFPPSSASSSSIHLPLPSPSPPISDATTYARLLALFLDAPTPLSPFSVHAFAAQGKLLGKNPGEWFGPSTAAGAIKTLVNGHEPAGVRVVSCVDGAVYETEVVRESRGPKADAQAWTKPVLILVNVRLGIDGVNPIYHEAIKGIFRLSQSVGIAGGRPSSSYYFVGAQASCLFYIDPHHPRPAVPAVAAPVEVEAAAGRVPLSSPRVRGEARAKVGQKDKVKAPRKRVDTQETAKLPAGGVEDSFVTIAPSPSSSSPTTPLAALSSSGELLAERQLLDSFLLSAYPDSAWTTYHAEKVRRCSLSSLDPSMLLGFLVQSEEDWADFKKGVEELFRSSSPIFSIASAPPRWMRHSTSAAVPAAPTSLAADDSFSDVAPSSPMTGPTGLDANNGEDSSNGFSEPDDWELDSTDGLSASPSPTPSGAEVGADLSGGAVMESKPSAQEEGEAVAEAEEEEWEEPDESSPSAASISTGSSSGAARDMALAPRDVESPSVSPASQDEVVVIQRPVVEPQEGAKTVKPSRSGELGGEWEGV
ncbi:hypothetical protein JCM11641_003156 [Rhodosporidiobolus odoratus]